MLESISATLLTPTRGSSTRCPSTVVVVSIELTSRSTRERSAHRSWATRLARTARLLPAPSWTYARTPASQQVEQAVYDDPVVEDKRPYRRRCGIRHDVTLPSDLVTGQTSAGAYARTDSGPRKTWTTLTMMGEPAPPTGL